MSLRILLGSRSPQRIELLSSILSPDEILVRPPLEEDEASFDDCKQVDAIDGRLLEIARTKQTRLLRTAPDLPSLTVDTVIVGFNETGRPFALGKPPDEEPAHSELVRRWFRAFYAPRPHLAKSAIVLLLPNGRSEERVVTTEVRFTPTAADLVDWYLSTGESRGKAGGYAIQGRGGLFVVALQGSLTNVIGLPVLETREMLQRAKVLDAPARS